MTKEMKTGRLVSLQRRFVGRSRPIRRISEGDHRESRFARVLGLDERFCPRSGLSQAEIAANAYARCVA